MINNDFSGATILVVDDTPTNLRLLLDYLEGQGFKTLIATSGERALKQLERIQPDLILLDVMMPGIDGFETCRRIKTIKTVREIPVIFMTALSETTDKVKGFEVGAVDYVTKPFQQEEVSARINTHLSIRSLQNRLQEQIAELDAFAHTVAHDLKNPLGVIISYNDLLISYGEEIDQDELQGIIQDMYRSGQKANNIIQELLLLASVKKEAVNTGPIDMRSTIFQAQSRLEHVILEYQGKITLPDEWPIAIGYSPWVEEVWANYLSNALKYGGRPPRVEFGATPQSDGTIKFWIRDNGPGLSPEAQATLFTEFTRLNKVRAQGHGLGLSIVKRIMNKLGGQAGVESAPGEGSTFYFILPEATD